MSKPTISAWFRFLGMNVRGTPAMKAEAVKHDLTAARRKADVLVTQEFKWAWYWRVAKAVLSVAGWRSSPGFKTGFRKPVAGGQAVMWDGAKFKRGRVIRRLLHKGRAGISEMRFLRAVLLRDKETGLRAWFGTTHFVVGGDEAGDGPQRREMMDLNLAALDNLLGDLVKTGWPVVFQLDANIKTTSHVYPKYAAILRKHGATMHGVKGIEYLFTIPGRKADIEIKGDWIVSARNLYTDHEGRGITFRLVKR